METMTATELREEIFHVLQNRSLVEIQHKAGSMILFPKEALSPQEHKKLGCEETKTVLQLNRKLEKSPLSFADGFNAENVRELNRTS